MVDIAGYVGNIGAGLSPSGPLGSIAMFILGGIAIGIVGYAGFVVLSYNVRVTIFKKTGTHSYETFAKGKFYLNKENGQTYFKLSGRNPKWNQPLDLDYLVVAVRGNRVGKHVYFAEDHNGNLQPIKPVTVENVERWTGWKNSDQEFAIGAARKIIAIAKRGDFWSKYGALIQMGFLALMVVMLIVLFRQLDGVVSGLQSVASTLADFKVISAGNETQVFA